MIGYHYVYTLTSVSHSGQVYTGHTQDLRQRLKEHNAGKVPHTSKFKPWIIRSATAFRDRTTSLWTGVVLWGRCEAFGPA